MPMLASDFLATVCLLLQLLIPKLFLHDYFNCVMSFLNYIIMNAFIVFGKDFYKPRNAPFFMK